MIIEVTIERLILDGVSLAPGERPAFQQALQDEFGRLLAGGALPPVLAQGSDVPSVQGGEIRLGPGGPAQWGKQIAGAVYRSLGQTEVDRS